MKRITIDDRLEFAAQSGVFEIYLFVWNNTAKKLVKEGLALQTTPVQSSRKGESYYRISWEDATVENIPEGTFDFDALVTELKKKKVPLTNAQLLWLMAIEANRN